MCYDYSQDNDIIFNSLKSVYVVFRPKRYHLFCPFVYLHEENYVAYMKLSMWDIF